MKPDLEALVAKWQAILRLQDWKFSVRYARYHQLAANRLAEVSVFLRQKFASIAVLDPGDYRDSPDFPPFDVEFEVVHELLHCHTEPFDRTEGPGPEHIFVEQAINSLAAALLSLDRRGSL